jgi:nucleoside-diphosphate-sugar epimerase
METVLVTGGSGRIGSALVECLNDHGYWTVNVDVTGGPGAADEFLEVDLTDAGEVFGAFARVDPDAVAHLGAIPNSGRNPDHVVYESNAMGAFHVLEAAAAQDVDAVAMASSIQAMGSIVPDAPLVVDSLPMDEGHRQTPQDSYALGKQTVEVLADGTARRPGAPRSLATFRFPLTLDRAEMRERFPADDGTVESLSAGSRDTLFAYLAAADAAEAMRRALETDLGGHERFMLSAVDTTVTVPTERVVEACYPDADLRESLTGRDPLVDASKAREVLGWAPETRWRDVVSE